MTHTGKGLSRRGFVGVGAGVGVAALIGQSVFGAQVPYGALADGGTFAYGTTGYGPEMDDAGLNPHANYSGWSCVRYGVGETLFKFSDSMEPESWLAESYEFTDDTTVVIKLREGVRFSSGRAMDAQAVKECLDDLLAVHDRAPLDLEIDAIEADGMTLTRHRSLGRHVGE